MRQLGCTNEAVSEIGHGLWGMGSWSGSDDVQSLAALRASAAAGCTFFDSAWAYGEGRADRLLGHLRRERKGERRLFLASKVPPATGRFPASAADTFEETFPRGYVLDCAERIRRELGVETIPLLQLHVWHDDWTDAPELPAIIEELKTARIIKHFGVSLNRWEPKNGVRAAASGLIDVVQVIYNIFDQAPEDELFPVCQKHGVGVIARVPLDEGSLGGSFTKDTRFPADDWRSRYFGPENLPETLGRVDRLKDLLPPGMSLPQLALRFVLANPTVSTVIVGMRDQRHIEENLACSGIEPLPPELIDALRSHRWDRQVAPWAN